MIGPDLEAGTDQEDPDCVQMFSVSCHSYSASGMWEGSLTTKQICAIK